MIRMMEDSRTEFKIKLVDDLESIVIVDLNSINVEYLYWADDNGKLDVIK